MIAHAPRTINCERDGPIPLCRAGRLSIMAVITPKLRQA